MVRPDRTRLTGPAALPGPGAFRSALRSERLTSQLGVWLGAAFAVAFVTGYLSHAIQHPPAWFWWPTRPVWLYRLTQGVHVATGLATVPLLGVKLWSVYPKLFTWPPARSVLHALERASVAVLVASALFQVVTGVLNVSRWYTPMPFFFTTAHYWTGWLAIGALLVHVAVQLPVVRNAFRQTPVQTAGQTGSQTGGQNAVRNGTAAGLSRRGLLGTVAASAGLITITTAGQTFAPLGPLSVLAPRRPTRGPQRLPVNTSAHAADVMAAALDPGYRLRITGPGGTRRLSLADLSALPQHTVSLPITCVEGWSADAVWTGVRIADLAALVSPPGLGSGGFRVLVESLQQHSRYRTSVLPPTHAGDPLTLLALRLHDRPLALDHGYPARIIAPNRPGVLQTKWVAALRVEWS
jgi:DMSO/TMAO reductase YedYZ molybdopterin-dependent catalytic subunit